jgi:hypothetical protein
MISISRPWNQMNQCDMISPIKDEHEHLPVLWRETGVF